MRIAIVHSYYRNSNPSGENISVDRLVNVLKSRGHLVKLISKHSEDNPTLARKLTTAVRFITNLGWNPHNELKKFSPEVIHVHNMFPNFSSRWLNKWGHMTLLTLHNYRFICANGLLLRNGQYCDKCATESPISSIRFACYKNSAIETSPWYLRQLIDPRNFKVLTRVNRIICLNRVIKEFIHKWVDSNIVINVIPNFVDNTCKSITTKPPDETAREYVYAGGLTPEKGILELATSWDDAGPKLHIFGDGPLKTFLPIQENIVIHGKVDNATLQNQIRKSTAVIIPSLCLENLPTVYLEAISNGVPVIANEACVVGELVKIHGTGRSFRHFSEIPNLMESIQAGRDEYVRMALQAYEDYYNPNTVIRMIESVYEEIVENYKGSK